jgi:selenocysteine lyase/cysteine desulfurase
MPLDAAAIGADFISATGRKFLRGPRGTGFLWASDRALELEPAIIDLHAAEWTAIDEYAISPGATRYESWEKSYAAMLGMGAAADYALNLGLEVIQSRITWLADVIRTQLAQIPGVEVRDRGEQRTGIVVFCAPGHDTETFVASIKAAGVNVSFSPQNYARRDFGTYGLGEPTGYVRVSPHVYNDDSDIDALIDVVRRSVHS